MHKKGVLMIQEEWLSTNYFFLFLHQKVSHPIPQMTQAGAPPRKQLKFCNIFWEKGCCTSGCGQLPWALLSRGSISTFNSSQHSSWAGREPHTYRCAGEKIQNTKEKPKATYNSDNIVLVECLINDLRSFRADRVQDKLNLNLVHSST